MKDFYFSSNQVKALISILGEKNGLLIEPQFSTSTDRNDNSVIKNISDFLELTSKVAQILNVDVKDLVTVLNDEESDHETVTHKVILNPFGSYKKGFIHKMNKNLYVIEDYDYNTSNVTLTCCKTGEKECVNFLKLQTINWMSVYPELCY
jgi:predicted regulator of Ras-like GTPase activity (Roadblock/LC7/MglB family)